MGEKLQGKPGQQAADSAELPASLALRLALCWSGREPQLGSEEGGPPAFVWTGSNRQRHGPLQADWESQHTLLGKEKGRWSQKKIRRLRTGRVEGRMNVVNHRDQAAALTASISFLICKPSISFNCPSYLVTLDRTSSTILKR